MIDLTKPENEGKKIERVVEGYSKGEKLVARITARGVELRTYRAQTAPTVFASWTRIHRDAIERELADTRKKL